MELTRALLNREETLRYLGYRGTEILPHTEKLIEDSMSQILELARPAYVYRRYSIWRPAERTEEKRILVKGTNLCLTGEDICRHLEGCAELYLLCATIGAFVDRQIRLKMVTDPAAGVVLDSCGSVAVEQVTEAAEQEIEREVTAEGKQITWRFSPGYGDLPLELQQEIADILDLHRRLGVSVSEDMLLAPSKSVTAIIGVMDTPVWMESEKEAEKADREANKEKEVDTKRIQEKCERCSNRERCNFYVKGKSCRGGR